MIKLVTKATQRIYLTYLLIALLAGGMASAQGNEDNLISGDFQGASFNEFAAHIESQTPFRFYYDDSLLDSIVITIKFHNAHLASVLDSILRNTDLYYTIYNNSFVFINKGFPFNAKLPYGFFTGKQDTVPIITQTKTRLPLRNQVSEPPETKQDISIENKLFDIGIRRNEIPKSNVNVAGYVRDAQTGESLSGAIIYMDHPKVQVTSDQFGYYSLTLPAGRHTLNIMAPGMFDTHRHVMLYSDGTLDINIDEKVIKLREVVVEAGKEKNVRSVTLGLSKITIQEIKQMPAVMGEADVLRTVLTLPGVKSVGEASTGLNVRGGASDQNLILFNGLNVYNPTHLFGFFSAFDPDLIKDVSLYKGNVPAKYGGRTSSVLDITSLDGNDKKISGSAGISLLTSKFTVDGPLSKKTTFVLGARTTYSNWIFHNLPHEYKKSRASFQDITLHINHKLNRKNNIYINGYLSNDKFNLNSDTSYHYNNRNANISWRHNFNNRFYGVLLGGIDHYEYKVTGYDNPVNAYWLTYKINQYKFNADFNYFLSNKHKITFGLNSLYYHIHPGSFTPRGSQSLITPDTLEAEQALETALYFSDEFRINSKFSVEGGIRYSYYDYLGPKNVYTYAPGLPRQEGTMTGTDYYSRGKTIKTYSGPEYRASARYVISENTSIKAAYNTLRQYIHVISNTTTVSPTDVWKLSDQDIKPEWSGQASLGLYKNFQSNTIETSVEVYYKWIKNNLDYKSGAVLVMNHHIETDVFNTKGKAYGIEFLLKKATGKLNGWISYTFSRALIQQDDPLAGEVINGGNYYPTSFDQPHSLSVIGNYRINHRFSVSMNVIYNTGRPITVPIGIIDYGNSARFIYSDRNEYRIPDYFRMDLSMNIEGNHKVKQLTHNSWNIGFYNLTGRKNAYSVYFISQNGDVHGYKLAIFGTVIPFVTYNIRF